MIGRPVRGVELKTHMSERMATCAFPDDMTTFASGLPQVHYLRPDLDIVPASMHVQAYHKRLLKHEQGLERSADGFKPDWLSDEFTPNFAKPFGKIALPRDIKAEDWGYTMSASYPFTCQGLVENSEGASGSGSLVGTRLMLTADHCIPWDTIQAGQPAWIRFTPFAMPFSTNNQRPYGYTYVTEILSAEQTDATTTPQEDGQTTSLDYAVCRLADPLGINMGYLGYCAYNADWDGLEVWSSTAYPFGGGPWVISNASIYGFNEYGQGLDISSNAWAMPGMSGGGYWAWFDLGGGQFTTRAIGVISTDAIPKVPPSNLGGGNEMAIMISEGRSLWPT